MSYASIILIVSIVVFAIIVWWAYSPRFKKRHEQDGMIPFLDSKGHPPESFEKGKGQSPSGKQDETKS